MNLVFVFILRRCRQRGWMPSRSSQCCGISPAAWKLTPLSAMKLAPLTGRLFDELLILKFEKLSAWQVNCFIGQLFDRSIALQFRCLTGQLFHRLVVWQASRFTAQVFDKLVVWQISCFTGLTFDKPIVWHVSFWHVDFLTGHMLHRLVVWQVSYWQVSCESGVVEWRSHWSQFLEVVGSNLCTDSNLPSHPTFNVRVAGFMRCPDGWEKW